MTAKSANRPDLSDGLSKQGLNQQITSFIKTTFQTVGQWFIMPPTHPPTLPEEWMARTRISSWVLGSFIMGVGLYALFLMAVYLGNTAADRLGTGDDWLRSLISPAIVIYLLLIMPLLRRLLGRTIDTFHVMVPYNDRFKRLEAAAYSLKRRREWLAITLGTVVGWLVISRPVWGHAHLAWIMFDLVRDVLVFGLLAWHIYAALARTQILTLIHGQVQELNIFKQTAPVAPILQWAAGVIICLFGGIFVGIFFIPEATLFSSTSAILYGTFGLAIVLVVVFSRVPASLLAQLRVLRAFILFMLVAVVGTIGFRQFEGWDISDSLYATVITMTTIGYGDFSPTTPEGRVFTIFLSLFAIGIGGYAVTSLASFVIEGNFHRFIQGKKVDKQIVQMKDHYILCGAGHIGKQIAVEFYRSQVPFVVIEHSADGLEELLREIEIPYVQGDATQDETLLLAGVERAQGLVAALSDDKDNVFVVLSARSLNTNLRIIAKTSEEKNRKKLIKAGADSLVSPNAVSGRRMVSEMLHSEVVTLLDEMLRAEQQTGQTLRLEELHVNHIKVPALVERLEQDNLTITDIGQRTELMVVAVKRHQQQAGNGGDPYIYTPRGNTPLHRGDVLLVIATPQQRLKLQHDVLEQNPFEVLLARVLG